jgi:hypothetical protein
VLMTAIWLVTTAVLTVAGLFGFVVEVTHEVGAGDDPSPPTAENGGDPQKNLGD